MTASHCHTKRPKVILSHFKINDIEFFVNCTFFLMRVFHDSLSSSRSFHSWCPGRSLRSRRKSANLPHWSAMPQRRLRTLYSLSIISTDSAMVALAFLMAYQLRMALPLPEVGSPVEDFSSFFPMMIVL